MSLVDVAAKTKFRFQPVLWVRKQGKERFSFMEQEKNPSENIKI